jgi:hypothetical protein
MMPAPGVEAELSRDWIDDLRWLLPAARPGYDAMFQAILSLRVIGLGRWGEGDVILGRPGDTPDISGPMAPVFAHGSIEYTNRTRTVIVHDADDGRIEIQIETRSHGADDDGAELRRSASSSWLPGQPSPQRAARVREIRFPSTAREADWTLAVCPDEQRVWLYERASGVNWPIPATAVYHELMRLTGERRPEIALAPKQLFTSCDSFRDADLVRAVYACNAGRPRFSLPPIAADTAPKVSFIKRLFRT